jgi:hypothetical protein
VLLHSGGERRKNEADNHRRNASASGRLSPLDVVIVASLIGLVIGEVDLDRLVFGTRVIAPRFFVDARVALSWRLIAVVVVVGVPAAIGIFALTRIRRFWQEGGGPPSPSPRDAFSRRAWRSAS